MLHKMNVDESVPQPDDWDGNDGSEQYEDQEKEAYLALMEQREAMESGNKPSRLPWLDWVVAVNGEYQTKKKKLLQMVESILKEEERRINWFNEKRKVQFEREMQERYDNRPDQSKKHVKLLTGKIETRKAGDSIEIQDEQKALEWAGENCPDALRVRTSLVKTPLKDYFKDTGELPPGCQYIPEYRKMSVKPVDGDDILKETKQLPEGNKNELPF